MGIQKNNHSSQAKKYLKLAFELARINLGKTKENPSVGCIVVKNNSVISSGYTSIYGRPHAEFNALNKNLDFKNSDIFITMEPCTHYGKTPPCTNLIIKKKIKNVFYAFNDINKLTAFKAKKTLKSKNIKTFKKRISKYKYFYDSYYKLHKKNKPFIDAKIAISKDFFTINKSNKWITNELSRKRVHLIRSEYDCILTTSKTLNKDNALLNCRLNGFDKNKPDLIIVDQYLKTKKNLKLFNFRNKRKIILFTTIKKDKKLNFFKSKNVKIKIIKKLNTVDGLNNLFIILKNLNYNRVLIETGLLFINELLKYRLLSNLYIFQSSYMLGKKGSNNTSSNLIKKLNITNKIKVNLDKDKLYKVKLNNV